MDHVQEADHGPTVGGPAHRAQRISAPAGPGGPRSDEPRFDELTGAARSVPGMGGPGPLRVLHERTLIPPPPAPAWPETRFDRWLNQCAIGNG